jgi:hypothetical protein
LERPGITLHISTADFTEGGWGLTKTYKKNNGDYASSQFGDSVAINPVLYKEDETVVGAPQYDYYYGGMDEAGAVILYEGSSPLIERFFTGVR